MERQGIRFPRRPYLPLPAEPEKTTATRSWKEPPCYGWGVKWEPEDYRHAALERIGESNALRREERFGLSMYAAGVAAECMLRAYHNSDRPFDERHDLAILIGNCDLGRLGEKARQRLRGPLQTAHLLWSNDLRFSHEVMVRQRLHRMRLDRDVKRGVDPLKAKCVELFDACAEIVAVGDRRWKKN